MATIKASDIIRAAGICRRVSKSAAQPATHILAGDGSREITFTSWGLSDQVSMAVLPEGGEVAEGLDVATDAGLLESAAKGFAKDELVSVTVDDKGKLVLASSESNSIYRLLTLPTDNLPEFAAPEARHEMSFGNGALLAGLIAVDYAKPAKDHRRILLGTNVSYQSKGRGADTVYLTATDGKKLARVAVEVDEALTDKGAIAIGFDTDSPLGATIPDSAMAMIRKLDSEIELIYGSLTLGAGGGAVTADGVCYIFRTLDGKYPDVNAVIPKDTPNQVKANNKALIQLIRRAMVVTDEKSRSVVLSLDAANACIRARAANSSTGNYAGEIEAEHECAGKGAEEVAFGCQYLIETLESLPGEVVSMRYATANAPWLFGEAGDVRTTLLMPIKLSEARAGDDPGSVED